MINESSDRQAYMKYTRLYNILDEELTYRISIKKYLYEDDESSDSSTDPFAMLSVDPDSTESSEKDKETKEEEDGEEVPLAKLVFSTPSEEAAEKLKDYFVDAGISEDKLDIETGSEKESEDEESEDKSKNESLYYRKLRKLFEEEGSSDEDSKEDSKEDSDDNQEEEKNDDSSDEKSEESSDKDSDKDSDKEEDTVVKLILSDPDEDDIEKVK